MKINRSIIKLTLLGAVLGTGVACTANYEEINKNPYETNDSEMERDGYNIRAALLGMQEYVVPANDINLAQFSDMLLGGSWGGYLADTKPEFNDGKYSTYDPRTNWIKVMYTDIIPKIYPFQKKLQLATEDAVPLSVGLILKVAAMHRVVDCYGPTPYSKVGADGKLTAPLDTQKEAYDAMFADLDQAIGTLTEHRNETLSPNADKVYSGDVVKWIKLANSLKLRLAMRIVYAAPGKAQQMAEEAVSHEIGVMSSNGDNAAFSGFGKDGNPFYKTMYEYNGGDSRIGADITSFMNGYQDPRRAAYFKLSTFAETDGVTNAYIGFRSGIEIPAPQSIGQKYSNINYTSSTPLQWMNSAEVAFLRAEGALRQWNMGGTAESFYRQGVTLSFEQCKATDAESYLGNSTDKPESYKDPLGNFSYKGIAPNITIAWNEGAGFETNLERIITQKWIAIFPLGHEAWAEYRRTGYPKLMPVVKNNSKGVVDSNKGARRMTYPEDEYATNGTNLNAAISADLPGGDKLSSHVWWDCKPKN